MSQGFVNPKPSPLPVNQGGTGVLTSTGTGSVVLNTSPALVTPALGTPSSGNLSNCTNAPANTVLSKQIFTSGSGTYTPTAGARYVWIRAIGGGGQGGGCTSTTSQFGVGGGGGAGGYAELWEAATSRAYSVGAAGSGSAAGSTGGNGGATTFGTAGAQINVAGGSGGLAANAITTAQIAVGGAGGTSTTGTLLISGSKGSSAAGSITYFSTCPGDGACSPFGGYGAGTMCNSVTSVAGLAATGYGSGGGGGSCAGISGSAAGGNGGSGVIIITEYA